MRHAVNLPIKLKWKLKKMNVRIALAVLITFAYAACSSSGNSDQERSQPTIIGEWFGTELSFSSDSIPSTVVTEAKRLHSGTSLTFNEDGTCIVYLSFIELRDTLSYNVDGTRLITISGLDTSEYSIEYVTDSSLQISQSLELPFMNDMEVERINSYSKSN